MVAWKEQIDMYRTMSVNDGDKQSFPHTSDTEQCKLLAELKVCYCCILTVNNMLDSYLTNF